VSRTKVSIAADGLTATIDSGVYVYSARVGVMYPPRKHHHASHNVARGVRSWDASGVTLEGENARRTSATWASFISAYNIPRERKVGVKAARRAEVATRRQADGRIDEILRLLRRIAAELGVTS